MLRALIIDNEAHMREKLNNLLTMCCPMVEVVGEATGIFLGIKKILEVKPDLVFIDINMKDGTGYDVLHELRPIGFKVIFISVFDKKTIQAFKLSSVAYLIKPINPIDLIEAIKQVENMELKHFDLYLEALKMNILEAGF